MNVFRAGLFSRAVSSITAAAFSLAVVTPSWADALDDAAANGQSFGTSIAPTTSPASADSAGNITLFPDSATPMTLPAESIFPGATGQFDAQTSVYGDNNAMIEAGNSAQTTLATDPSTTGEAYRVLTDSSALSRPDLRNDPVWGQTDYVNQNLGVLAKDFGDCSQQSQINESSRTVHVPDYINCTRLRTGGGGCDINHNLVVETRASATVSVGVYGVSRNAWQFDLRNGSWSASGDGTEFTAVIPTLDYAQVCSGSGAVVKTAGTWDWPEAPVKGELDTSSCTKVVQEPSCKNNLVGKIEIIDNCSSGEGWYKYASKVQFEWVAIKEDNWWPESCVDDAKSALGGFCEAQMTETNPPPGGCQTFNGVQICEGDELYALIGEPPVPGISKISGGIQVGKLECNYWKGQMDCWTGADGQEHCPTIDTLQESDCIEMEKNPSCGFISSECADGGMDEYGTCFVQTETWDCGYDQAVPQTSETTSTQCAGPIRCMGGECVNQEPEVSGDFYRAAAALDAAAYIGEDGNCGNATTGGTCKVFGGDDMECKKAVGGIVNCCEKPDGVSLTDYITMLMAVRKLDGVLMAESMNGTVLQGSWEMLRQPVASTWSAVKQPFSSAVNSMMGNSSASASTGALEGAFGEFKQDIINQTADWVGQTFGEQAKGALFSQTGSGYALNSALSTVVSGVMTAYMIYQITMVLIQLIWQCEDDEFELGAKRALKSCHFVGSYCATKTPFGCIEKRDAYCCFNAPLSRILQEQIRPQLGLSWGKAKNPECGAIPVEQLANVDWSRVNLDEWIGILAATGNLKTPDNIGMDALTGSGSFLNVDGQREDSATRAVNRLNGIDTFGVKQDAASELFATPR